MLGHPQDLGHGQIGLGGLHRLADQVAFVRLEAMQREAVLVRVDGDGTNAQLAGRPHDADGDLAAIGYQDALDLFHVG